MKGFRPKTLAEREGVPPDPRMQASYWARFHREALRLGRSWKGCAACPPERRDPSAKLEIHHVISQQRLKRWCREQGIPKKSLRELEILTDPRNSTLLDEQCHYWHTYGARPLHREAIPEHAWEFIGELGLTREALGEYRPMKEIKQK